MTHSFPSNTGDISTVTRPYCGAGTEGVESLDGNTNVCNLDRADPRTLVPLRKYFLSTIYMATCRGNYRDRGTPHLSEILQQPGHNAPHTYL